VTGFDLTEIFDTDAVRTAWLAPTSSAASSGLVEDAAGRR
jgi:hypothetical protein